MSAGFQESLFAKYSIDTNVILSFLGDGEYERYPLDVFGPQWDFLDAAFLDGRVVAARRVKTELQKWEYLDRVKAWRDSHDFVFQDITTDEQLAAAKAIVNQYPAYGLNWNYLCDLEVMALAKARALTVISLESPKQHRADRPKIPNVCDEFRIGHLVLLDFLREEGFAHTAPPLVRGFVNHES
jgi:hypothetical protein